MVIAGARITCLMHGPSSDIETTGNGNPAMNKVSVMKHVLRLMGFVWLGIIAAPPAHAAWTNTDVPGITTTPVGTRPVGIFVYTPVRGAVVLNKEATTQWLINLNNAC
jgi:hypothetical protein